MNRIRYPTKQTVKQLTDVDCKHVTTTQEKAQCCDNTNGCCYSLVSFTKSWFKIYVFLICQRLIFHKKNPTPYKYTLTQKVIKTILPAQMLINTIMFTWQEQWDWRKNKILATNKRDMPL